MFRCKTKHENRDCRSLDDTSQRASSQLLTSIIKIACAPGDAIDLNTKHIAFKIPFVGNKTLIQQYGLLQPVPSVSLMEFND